MSVLENNKELEWDLFSVLPEEHITTAEEKEETTNVIEILDQHRTDNAVVRFVLEKGKKKEILTGKVTGVGWHADNPNTDGPADTIWIKTEDKETHLVFKRHIIEMITPLYTAS